MSKYDNTVQFEKPRQIESLNNPNLGNNNVMLKVFKWTIVEAVNNKSDNKNLRHITIFDNIALKSPNGKYIMLLKFLYIFYF